MVSPFLCVFLLPIILSYFSDVFTIEPHSHSRTTLLVYLQVHLLPSLRITAVSNPSSASTMLNYDEMVRSTMSSAKRSKDSLRGSPEAWAYRPDWATGSQRSLP